MDGAGRQVHQPELVIPPRAINRANRSHMVPSESINVEPEENVASHAPSDMASVSRGADGGVGPADHSFGVAPASVDPEPAAAAVPAPVVLLLQQSLHLTC